MISSLGVENQHFNIFYLSFVLERTGLTMETINTNKGKAQQLFIFFLPNEMLRLIFFTYRYKNMNKLQSY